MSIWLSLRGRLKFARLHIPLAKQSIGMDPWRIMNGRDLASNAYIADIVNQINDKTSDVYSDKPAPSWLSQHINEGQVYGLAHGNLVCYCPLCLVDVAKADTFVAANIGSGTRKRILRCTENVKLDVLA